MRPLRGTDLLVAIAQVIGVHPDAGFIKNDVGNIVIIVDDEAIGYVDIRDGEVSYWS